MAKRPRQERAQRLRRERKRLVARQAVRQQRRAGAGQAAIRTAATVAQNVRRSIARQMAGLNRRVNANPAGFTAESILAGMNVSPADFQDFLAKGVALGAEPAPADVAETPDPAATEAT